MAELALGGIQIAVGSKRPAIGTCAHTDTLSTLSMGIERVVCETCGHLSVHFHNSLTGPIDRERFARPADEVEIEGVDKKSAGSPRARFGFGGSAVGRSHLPVARARAEQRSLSLQD